MLEGRHCAHLVARFCLLLAHLHFAFLLLDALKGELALILQVLLLLFSHNFQLLRHLQLALAFGLFGFAAQLFLVLLAQDVESGARIANLRDFVLQRLVPRALVVDFLHVAQQLGVQGGEGQEERLDGGVIADVAPPSRVGLHAIDKHIQLAAHQVDQVVHGGIFDAVLCWNAAGNARHGTRCGWAEWTRVLRLLDTGDDALLLLFPVAAIQVFRQFRISRLLNRAGAALRRLGTR